MDGKTPRRQNNSWTKSLLSGAQQFFTSISRDRIWQLGCEPSLNLEGNDKEQQQRHRLQKRLAAGAVAILAALALNFFFNQRDNNDPPILVGDGSVLFSADQIDVNSKNELEVAKILRKVYTIKTVDLSAGGSPPSVIDVKGRDWTLTSASGAVVVSLDPLLFGQESGVKANCGNGWNGTGTYYSCDPSDGSKFTPATLKFNDGNCPGTGASTCMLSCMSGRCQIQLEYKIKK
jgi:hypothetical protein